MNQTNSIRKFSKVDDSQVPTFGTNSVVQQDRGSVIRTGLEEMDFGSDVGIDEIEDIGSGDIDFDYVESKVECITFITKSFTTGFLESLAAMLFISLVIITCCVGCFCCNKFFICVSTFFAHLNLADALGDAKVQVGPTELFPSMFLDWGPQYVLALGTMITVMSIACTVCCCVIRKWCA